MILLDNRLCQARVFLEELHDTVGQLWMVHGQALHLVQRQQRFEQKCLVLLLQRQGEAVDNGAENLEQLGNSVVMFGLVNEP